MARIDGDGAAGYLRANFEEAFQLLLSGAPAAVARSKGYVALRRRLSRHPRRFEPAGPLAEWRQGEDWRHRKLVFPNTDLVVEGFPGSANSYLANSLRDALGPEVHVTSHFHHTVQLARALAFGVPAVVVVRQPLAAADSLKSKQPALGDALILWRWWIYHRFVTRHRARLTVVLFDEVVRDLDIVRRRCPAVARWLDRPLAGDATYRRPSNLRRMIQREGWACRLLLSRCVRLYEGLAKG